MVKELVHGNFESAVHFLQRFDARDGVSLLDARDVATQEARALLDVTLREVFLFADSA